MATGDGSRRARASGRGASGSFGELIKLAAAGGAGGTRHGGDDPARRPAGFYDAADSVP